MKRKDHAQRRQRKLSRRLDRHGRRKPLVLVCDLHHAGGQDAGDAAFREEAYAVARRAYARHGNVLVLSRSGFEMVGAVDEDEAGRRG